MERKNNIFEELSKMKNLIHAKAGTVISEQEIQEIGFGAAAQAAAQAARTTPSGYNLSGTQAPAANNFQSNYSPYSFAQSSGMLVDCSKLYQFSIDMPSAQMQQDFAQKTGLNPKEVANFPYFCSGQKMGAKLAEIGKPPASPAAPNAAAPKAAGQTYSQSVGDYAKKVQKSLGTTETGKIESADLDKILAKLGGDTSSTSTPQDLPKKTDGAVDLDKILADLQK